MALIQIVLGVAPNLLRELVCREIELEPGLVMTDTVASEAELEALLARANPHAVLVTVPSPVALESLDRLLETHRDFSWFVIYENGHIESRMPRGPVTQLGDLSAGELVQAVHRITGEMTP